MGRRPPEARQPDPEPLPGDDAEGSSLASGRAGLHEALEASGALPRAQRRACSYWGRMANQNIERFYEALGAYEQGDEERLRQMIHPEGEIYGAPGIINSGTYYGFDGFQQWIGHWEEAWEEISYEVGEIVEVGDSVLVVPAHIVGRGAGSGLEVDSTFGWVYEWKDGLLVRYQVHPSLEEALEAARELAAESS
jgi:ketosteroid isomerase-like protein